MATIMNSDNGETTQGPTIPHRSIDEPRPIRVIVVGAGISGILTAIELQKRMLGLDITVYEKNEELGGTWWENRYPGCACGMYYQQRPELLLILLRYRYSCTLLSAIF